MERFRKQEPELDNALLSVEYKQGDTIEVVVKDIPDPLKVLPNGKTPSPVGFTGDFVVIITSGLPKDTQIGDRISVTLLKITKSHSGKKMGFGCVAR